MPAFLINSLMRNLFVPLIATLLFSSCKPKDDCDGRMPQPIAEHIKAGIPYQTGETVRFKSSDGAHYNLTVNRDFQILRPDLPKVCEEYMEVSLMDGSEKFAWFLQRGASDADTMIQLTLYPPGKPAGDAQWVLSEDGEMSQFLISGTVTFFPVLNIDGTDYTKVGLWENDQKPVTKLYYNVNFGIIRFETKDSVVFTRE